MKKCLFEFITRFAQSFEHDLKICVKIDYVLPAFDVSDVNIPYSEKKVKTKR